jgi:hypothetical protein
MKIPDDVLAVFESETEGLNFGEVTLTVYLRDGKPRYVIGRQRSIMKGVVDLSAGSGGLLDDTKN